MNNGSHIKIQNLKKTFGEKIIIDNLNCEFYPGESIVILGESGEGKSVTMSMLGTLMEPTSGSITIDNQELCNISLKKKEKIMNNIGFLFQSAGLFDHLTVWENVAFRELFVKKMNKHKAKTLAIEKLRHMNIKEDSYDLKPPAISGGMQKRVAIARTIMKEPKLLLLDEPTSGLDPIMSNRINEVINKTRKILKSTIVTITHDLNSALQIADKIFVLQKGKFIWSGKSEDVLHTNIEYIKYFVECANIK